MNITIEALPILDLEHPGSHDPEYRKRREWIAEIAIRFHTEQQQDIPIVRYTPEEDKTWNHVFHKLAPLHEQWACSWYHEGRKKLFIDGKKIPQLHDLNERLSVFGFRLEPIHGLVSPREFLMKLGEGIMLSTQYIRHHSKPEFTPEPDIIHEVLGHVPMFTHAPLRELSILIGRAARDATEEDLTKLNRLYWYSIEYGLIREKGEVKAFGAGLLGGIHDFTSAFSGNVIIKPFVMKDVLETDYNYSFEQPHFFVIPSFEYLAEETKKLIAGFGRN